MVLSLFLISFYVVFTELEELVMLFGRDYTRREFLKFSEVSGKYAFGLMEKLKVKLEVQPLMVMPGGSGKDFKLTKLT